MYCKNCGYKIDDTSEFCTSCGKRVVEKEVYYYEKKVRDNPSHLAGVVSCCFPIVGLILYFIWKDEKPESAKLVCYWMIAGLVLWVLVYFFGFAASFSNMYYY